MFRMKTKLLLRSGQLAVLLTGSLLAGACATHDPEYVNDRPYSSPLVILEGAAPTAPTTTGAMVSMDTGCGPVLRGDVWMPCAELNFFAW
jgi:hypothetical protein